MKHLSVCLATKVARAKRKPLLALKRFVRLLATWRYRFSDLQPMDMRS
ncbi:MAG: hypothetical protein ACI31W_07905 [Lactococcus sp.]